MPGPNLQAVRFSDFTPGIRHNPGADYPPGTAIDASRCIARPGGGLQGMPRRSNTYAGNDFLGANPASGIYLVNGLIVGYPIIPGAGAPNPYSGAPNQIFLGVEWQDGVNHQFRLERIRIDENPLTRQTIENTSFADTSLTPGGWGLTWGMSRANRAAVTSPGQPVLYYSWAPSNAAAGWFVAQFPNDTTPNNDTPYHIGSPTITAQPTLAVHQGRAVVAETTAYDFGTVSKFSTSENIRYSNVYNPTVWSPIQNYVPENPSGYIFFYSMSANELFALKRAGGVAIIGDLDDPTVTNLPMVVGSTIFHRPTPSPLGLIYGSAFSGLWAWAHGDSSNHLSEYMTPDFWMIGGEVQGEPLLACSYQFDIADRLVLVPNNYVLDTDTQSFWRIDDTSYATIRFWARSGRFIYGAVSSYTHSALTTIYSWDLDNKSSVYSWTSHPVWQLLDTIIEIRQLVIEAKGQGTVTVTCTSRDGSTSSKAFTLANTGAAERIRGNFAMKSYGLTVTISTNSGNTSVDAPTVYAVSVMYRSQEHLAQG